VSNSILQLEELWDIGREFCNQTKYQQNSWERYFGALLFTKLFRHTATFLQCVPESRFYESGSGLNFADLCSAAAIARCLTENYLVLHYLCIQVLPADEQYFKKLLWYYHETCEQIFLIKNLPVRSTYLPEIRAEQYKLRKTILGDPFFNRMSETWQPEKIQNFLDRPKPIIGKDKEICKSAKLNINLHRAVYKQCSNYTHSSCLSITILNSYRTGDDRCETLFRNFAVFACTYVVLAIRDFRWLFPELQAVRPDFISEAISGWESFARYDGSEEQKRKLRGE